MIYIAPMRAAVIYCVDHLERFDVAAIEHAAGTSHISAVVYLRQLTRLSVVSEDEDIYCAGPRFAPWAAHVPRTRPGIPLADSRVYDKSRRQLLSMQVRRRLSELGKSYGWLAREAGVSKTFISYIIHCQRPASAETVDRIIRVMEAEHARQTTGIRTHADAGRIPDRAGEGPDESLRCSPEGVRASGEAHPEHAEQHSA